MEDTNNDRATTISRDDEQVFQYLDEAPAAVRAVPGSHPKHCGILSQLNRPSYRRPRIYRSH